MRAYLYYICIFCVFGCKSSIKEPEIGSINGDPVYFKDVDIPLKQFLYDELDKIYIKRHDAFNQYAEHSILEKESSRFNLNVENYVDSFFNKNSSRFEKQYYSKAKRDTFFPALDGNSYTRLSYYTSKGKLYLDSKLKYYIEKKLIDSLKTKYKILCKIDPPIKQEIKIDDLYKISIYSYPNVNHTLTIISDFECTSCRSIYPALDSIITSNKTKLNFQIIYFSDYVKPSGLFAYNAFLNGKYIEIQGNLYKDLYSYNNTLYFKNLEKLHYIKKSFISSSMYLTKKIKNNIEKLQARGVTNTPTFLIDGFLISNYTSQEDLFHYIDKMSNE